MIVGLRRLSPTYRANGKDANGNPNRPAYIGPAHEFGHAKGYDTGTESEDMGVRSDGTYQPNSTPPGEVNAMDAENMVRKEHGLALRPYYYIN